MAAEELFRVAFLKSSGNDLFKLLQEHLNANIPSVVKNNLILAEYDTPIVLARLDDSGIQAMEDFLRNRFDVKMLLEGETVEQYFGRFSNCREKFTFMDGHRKWLSIITDTCRSFQGEIVPAAPTDTGAQNTANVTEQNIKHLRALIFNWAAKSALPDSVKENLIFQLIENSSPTKILLHCPVKGCDKRISICFKSYQRYYKRRKPSKKPLSNPRWHIFVLQSHLLKKHSNHGSAVRESDNDEQSDQRDIVLSPSDSDDEFLGFNLNNEDLSLNNPNNYNDDSHSNNDDFPDQQCNENLVQDIQEIPANDGNPVNLPKTYQLSLKRQLRDRQSMQRPKKFKS